MKELSSKQRVFSSLLGGKVDKVPVTSLAGCAGTATVEMQKNAGIYFPEAHKEPDKMAKLAIESHRLTGFECVRVPFDFVEEPEALGCEIKWYNTPEGVPAVIGHPYRKPEDLKQPEDFLKQARIPVVLNAIKILRKLVGDFLPISSLALGPFSIAGELVGVENLMKWTVRNPGYVKEFVDFAVGIVIKYSKAQYQAGSDIIQIADPMASGNMISPVMFKEFVKPALTEIADSLGGLRILHICGFTERIVSEMAQTGFNGLSIAEEANIASIKPIVGDAKILGNLSSKNTLIMGSPGDVKNEARKALEAGVDLLEPGCGISPITPLENIKAMVEARDEFYACH